MIQMNLLTKQTQSHRFRKQTYGCGGKNGEEEAGSLESTGTHCYIYNG